MTDEDRKTAIEIMADGRPRTAADMFYAMRHRGRVCTEKNAQTIMTSLVRRGLLKSRTHNNGDNSGCVMSYEVNADALTSG